MRRKEIEDKFLDYIEGKLSQEETSEIDAKLASDPGLKASFTAYRNVMAAEKLIASKNPEIAANFAVGVMEKVERRNNSFVRRFFMEVTAKHRIFYGSFAALATVLLIVQVGRETEFGRRSESALMSPKDRAIAPAAPLDVEPGTAPIVAGSKGGASGEQRNESSGVKKEPEGAPPKVKGEVISGSELNKTLKLPSIVYNSISPTLNEESADRGRNPLPDARRPAPDRIISAERQVLRSNPVIAQALGMETSGFSNEVWEHAGGSDRGAGVFRRIDPSSAEKYQIYEENPRFDVAVQPDSTFSIDVDTASYTNARRFLKEGSMPPPESVRVEEFINYFSYNYPVQYDKPFTFSYEIAPSPLEPDRHILKLGLKTKDQKASDKPWNVTFLIDVSGSMMDSNKLPLVQRALRMLVERMGEKDRIGIVTYAGSAGVALESAGINDKAKILDAIDSLRAGGSTFGSGGINEAYALAQKNKIEGGVNRVILATDGDFNVGVTSHDELIKLIEEKRKTGITLTTLGFGTGNIRDGTMEQLANKGNGNYFYIDSFQEARKVLETDLVANMEVVAKDVKLQIEFNPEHVSYHRLIGYDNRKLNREDFNNDRIDAGEIGSGHTVTALYEVVLKDTPLSKKLQDEYRYQKKEERQKEISKDHSPELAFLKIRYKEPEADMSKLLEYPIEKGEVRQSADQASQDFRFASAVASFGTLLRNSRFAGSYSYQDILKLAESSRGEDKNGYRQEFIELVKNAASVSGSGSVR